MKYIKTYIFLAGFAITGVEMAASRLLAPYFGTSHVVWANVIGVILLAMAVGYTIGGKLVDKYPLERSMFGIGALGALVLAVLPLVSHILLLPLSQGLLETEMSIVVMTFFATLLLFGLPIFLLAMLSPFAVRLLSTDIHIVGSRSGSLSFWSTLGSIAGIYVTSFLLIPVLGVRESIWLFSILLFVPSIIKLPKKPLFSMFFVALVVVSYIIPTSPAVAFGTLRHQEESQYQHIKVVEMQDGTRYLYFNEGQGIQSAYNPSNDFLGMYYDYSALFPSFDRFKEKEELNVLILGYAGGTIGKLLHKYAPEGMKVSIDAVEIDPSVTQLSKQYFDVQESERNMYTMDGRTFLGMTQKKYDIVIVDAYSQEIYIPAHMITKEFFDAIKSVLSPEGLIAFNINVRDTNGALFQGTAATLQSVGLETNYYHVPDSYNHWVLASVSPLTVEVSIENTVLQAMRDRWTSGFTQVNRATGEIFTDNKSPVDMLIHKEILSELMVR